MILAQSMYNEPKPLVYTLHVMSTLCHFDKNSPSSKAPYKRPFLSPFFGNFHTV